jgi:2-hydroxychromene-2-carboxylate isomerase
MMRDIARLADKYGVTYNRPRLFPRMSVLPARIALLGQDEPWGRDFCVAVFRANFQHDLDIQAEDVVHQVLKDLSLDADMLIERAKTEAAKEALRRQVDRARNLGLFGAPTFFVGDEMFWGNDRLEDALEWARK